MAKITWDKTGERYFETGVDHGVLYLYGEEATVGSTSDKTNYSNGVAWNGLIGITENPEGGEPTPIWADNIKYLNLMSAESFGANVEAYTYPDEFLACDGSVELGDTGLTIGQQERKTFGLCYRTKVGNDVEGSDKGYKLHIVYGCLASPASKDYQTINDSPEAITFSWDVTTTPVELTVGGVSYKPTAHLVIDSRNADATKLADLETILYGDTNTSPMLPMPATVYTLLA